MRQTLNHHAPLCALLALVVLGAETQTHAGTPDEGVWPARQALGRDIPTRGAEAAPADSRPEPQGPLTLRAALELAAMHNPELASSACGVRAAEGTLRQAGAAPNPELEIEAEEFGGSDARQGYDAAQTTIRLSQTVELAGKRDKRRSLALSEATVAGWEYEAKRLDVLTQTKKAFVDVLAAQGQVALAESALTLAEDVRKAAAARVQAGKVPLLEETRAGVEVSSARLSRDKARRDLQTARRYLAASWGSATPLFTEAAGRWLEVAATPALASLAAALDQSPDVASWDHRVRSSQQTLAQARAERIPDITVSAGISRFEDDGTQAGLVGLSLPLPLFNRNAGGILAAGHQVTRAAYDREAARLRAATALAEAHGRLETAKAAAAAIKAELLPGSQQAFEAAQAGYREGKSGYLEVLDAQRTLGETQTQHLEALAEYHKAAADVEQLTGIPLNTL
jgi:cobalt-zinc-cadmium efflux system outer membrane protein